MQKKKFIVQQVVVYRSMGLLCLIIAVVILVAILDHDKWEETEEEERDSTLAGDRIRILIRFPHDQK